MKIKIGILTLALMAISIASSCKGENKEHKTDSEHSEMNHDGDKKEAAANDNQEDNNEDILKDYFNLKDALVKDDNKEANTLSKILSKNLANFDASSFSKEQKLELEELIEKAKAHAEEISNSTIKKQRRYFKLLTEEVTKIITITGSTNKVYEQFCPMYEGGSTWLSMSDEIRNPYYGSTMLQCGKVQREI
ncbi:DUF3347 domain-containing protein [Zobellia laminariae]|uniref:DUF3347 domain-containing protein n=1 Tax=Zobellia laminariae TaxID=248906 RepID=UPI0040562CA9